MPDFTVVFTYGASSAVTVSAPEGSTPDEIIDMAAQKDEASLCHQCGRHLTLGDPEPNLVEDEDGATIWSGEQVDRLRRTAEGTLRDLREGSGQGQRDPRALVELAISRLASALES